MGSQYLMEDGRGQGGITGMVISIAIGLSIRALFALPSDPLSIVRGWEDPILTGERDGVGTIIL